MAEGLEQKLDAVPQQSIWWRETRADAKTAAGRSALAGTLFLISTMVLAIGARDIRFMAILAGTAASAWYVHAAYRTYGLMTNKYRDTVP